MSSKNDSAVKFDARNQQALPSRRVHAMGVMVGAPPAQTGGVQADAYGALRDQSGAAAVDARTCSS